MSAQGKNYHLPKYVTQYFWGDDLTQLSWLKHKQYIIQTLLEKADLPAIKWLFQRADKPTLRQILPKISDPKSKNYWQIILK